MITLDRRRTYGGGSKPYDAEVLYIEATGGARIDTGYIPQGYGIQIDMKVYLGSYNSSSSWNCLLYSGDGVGTQNNAAYQVQRNSQTDYLTFGMNSKGTMSLNSPTNVSSAGMLHIIQLYNEEDSSVASGYKQICVLNGVKYSGNVSAGSQYSCPLQLMAAGSGATSYVNGRIYYFRVRNNGVLVRDMIPVRIDNVGYLYDKVTGQLFGNTYSSGSFSVGMDLVAPDNMLYWWDSDDPITYQNGRIWKDRMQGLSPTASNPNKVNGLYELQNADYSPNRIFQFYMNTSQRINLPAAWKIEVECIIPSDRIQSKLLMPFDFGSLGQATHGFGLSISTSNTVGVNYKPTSNNDGSLYGIASANRPTVQTDVLIKIEVGTERVNSSQVQLYLKYNGTKIYGIAPHNAVMYIKNWSLQNGYFGKGHTNGYSGGKYYLKSLKIYNNE